MTLIEIQATVCNGSEKNASGNLRQWLKKLERAGVIEVIRVDDGKLTSNGSYCYTLANDLGPKAPIVSARNGDVFDPNSNAVIKRPEQ